MYCVKARARSEDDAWERDKMTQAEEEERVRRIMAIPFTGEVQLLRQEGEKEKHRDTADHNSAGRGGAAS